MKNRKKIKKEMNEINIEIGTKKKRKHIMIIILIILGVILLTIGGYFGYQKYFNNKSFDKVISSIKQGNIFDNTKPVEELINFKIKSGDYAKSEGNLYITCSSDNNFSFENSECTLYDLSGDEPKILEQIDNDNCYDDQTNTQYCSSLHSTIKFGTENDGGYLIKNPTRNNEINYYLPSDVSFINDFYYLYTLDVKNGEIGYFKGNVKIGGKEATMIENKDEYTIYKDPDNDKYLLMPNYAIDDDFTTVQYVTKVDSYILDEERAAAIYYLEYDEGYYPKIIVYNYKTGKVLKNIELSFIEYYEDDKVVTDSFEKLNEDYNYFYITTYNDEKYYTYIINLDNYEEIKFDGYILYSPDQSNYIAIENDNIISIFNLKNGKINKLDKDSYLINLYDEKNEKDYQYYYKNNSIYDMNNNIIYELKENEKCAEYNTNFLYIYNSNSKYVVKTLDIQGKIVIDNLNNKYNLNYEDEQYISLLDMNSNLISYENDEYIVKSLTTDKQLSDVNNINDKYLKIEQNENSATYIIYDSNLNEINKLTYNIDGKLDDVSYRQESNNIVLIMSAIEDKQYYSVIYIYNLDSNKVLNKKPLYAPYYTNSIILSSVEDSFFMLAATSREQLEIPSSYLYYIKDSNIKVYTNESISNTDYYWIKYINDYNDKYLIFETHNIYDTNNEYIFIDYKKFN